MGLDDNIVVIGFTRVFYLFGWLAAMGLFSFGVYRLGAKVRRAVDAKNVSITGLWTWSMLGCSVLTLCHGTVEWLRVIEGPWVAQAPGNVDIIGSHACLLLLFLLPMVTIALTDEEHASA